MLNPNNSKIKILLVCSLFGFGNITSVAGEAIFYDSKDIIWKPFKGKAKISVLEGNPKRGGMVSLRIKVPPNTKWGPHHHENVERITVIKGGYTISYALKGIKYVRKLVAGSFYSVPANTVASASFGDTETILQLNTMGPLITVQDDR